MRQRRTLSDIHLRLGLESLERRAPSGPYIWDDAEVVPPQTGRQGGASARLNKGLLTTTPVH